MMRFKTIGLGVAAICCAATALGGSLYSDNFDTDTSAAWNINASSADTSAIFGFDYSTIGVPAAPGGGGSTLGLRMAANIDSPTGAEAITVSPMGQSFAGSYVLSFDAWVNANGPFPGGGAGSTEFITAGIGYDDVTVNRGGASGSGGWFAATGEGGSSRDYRAYKDSSEQFAESGQFFAGTSSAGGGAHNASDPYYGAFGAIDVAATVPDQTAAFPDQTGVTQTGSFGFAWHRVDISVSGDTALWSVDGLPIVQLDRTIGNDFPLAGNISIGHMDIFSSVSGNAAVSFTLIDNLVVTPEPTALALLTLGALLAIRRR